MEAYVALLRGINVGGKNVIKMSELLAAFEAMGLMCVRTFIQSGNVVFCAPEPEGLAERIERGLFNALNAELRAVVRSHRQMKAIVSKAPQGFGGMPKIWRYDVLFLREPLTAAQAMKHVRLRDGVDLAYPGKGVLYFQKLISRATQSYMARLVSMPVYQEMTIRNWNTTTKLLDLMQQVIQ
jgi:uncharacterized protein (DUF1697 family)